MFAKILFGFMLLGFSSVLMAATSSTEVEDFDVRMRRELSQQIVHVGQEDVGPLCYYVSNLRTCYDEVCNALVCLETASSLYASINTGLRILKNVDLPKHTTDGDYDVFFSVLTAQFDEFDRYAVTTVNGVEVFSPQLERHATTSITFYLDKNRCPCHEQSQTIFKISRDTLGFSSFSDDTRKENIDAKLAEAISIVESWIDQSNKSLTLMKGYKSNIAKEFAHYKSQLEKRTAFINKALAELSPAV